jgi:DNA (cytosine-5)-methyltransferase 1
LCITRHLQLPTLNNDLNSPKRNIKTISLFTGAGGLDIGFHQSGFDIVACVELEGHYCKTLEANRGQGKTLGSHCKILCEDVRTFDAQEFANQGVECIIGGPPCQTFSAAGRRSGGVLGTSDARGRLFSAYCRILKIIKPEVFVFENVYGLPGANNGGPWREIVSACSALGYELAADVLDAADYGVPQHRERLILVGYKAGMRFQFPLPTHGPDSLGREKLKTVADAIGDLQDPNEGEHDNLGGLYGHLLPLVPLGLNYSFFTREMGYPEPVFAWRSKFHDFLHKVDPAYPCRTIKAQPGKFTGPFHWKNRHFTLEELKRLQSFPDDYRIVGSYGKVVEQIGNSVPPLLASVIATSVREQLLRQVSPMTYPCRPAGFVPTFRQRQRDRTHHFKEVAARVISERFGQNGVRAAPESKTKRWTFYATYGGFFKKKILNKRPGKMVPPERTFKGVITIEREDINLIFDRLSPIQPVRFGIKIEIGGLCEGLTTVRHLIATAKIPDLHDIFFLWDAIEDALVQNSKFLTLIDVYGHYANRGDTVTIKTDVIGGGDTPMSRALSFFGNSENCGISVPRHVTQNQLGLSEAELDVLISDLRASRFDIRTNRTHPTIAPGILLCTYPFPLLSDKAHLERRLKVETSTVKAESLASNATSEQPGLF